jgi:hypothetical protein
MPERRLPSTNSRRYLQVNQDDSFQASSERVWGFAWLQHDRLTETHGDVRTTRPDRALWQQLVRTGDMDREHFDAAPLGYPTDASAKPPAGSRSLREENYRYPAIERAQNTVDADLTRSWKCDHPQHP